MYNKKTLPLLNETGLQLDDSEPQEFFKTDYSFSIPAFKSTKNYYKIEPRQLDADGGCYAEICIAKADSTSCNTGWNAGAIRQLEILIKAPLIWVLCIFHFLELPMGRILDSYFTKSGCYSDKEGFRAACKALHLKVLKI